jgi:hypothetical protein
MALEQIDRDSGIGAMAVREPLPATGLLTAGILVQIRLQQLSTRIESGALGEFADVVDQP